MPVAMIMLVRVFQNESADQIDAKPDHRDQQRIAIGNVRGMDQPCDGFDGDRNAGNAQDNCAGESGEITELARSETEAVVVGVAPRQPIGTRCQAQGGPQASRGEANRA